jgi:hypothetical protein
MQKYLCKRMVLDLDVSGSRASHNLPRIYNEAISATTTVNYIQPYNSAHNTNFDSKINSSSRRETGVVSATACLLLIQI